MLLFRISKTMFARDLAGTGGIYATGRWHTKGNPVIYAGLSEASATLETLVHSPLNIIPKDRSLIVFDVPDASTSETLDIKKLPSDWYDYPAPGENRSFGDRWLKNGASLLFKVPSAIAPNFNEWNVLINPIHPEMASVKIKEIIPYNYDKRLFIR